MKCQVDNIPVIINGICLLEIMEKLSFKLGLHIYYKRMNPDGSYYHQEFIESELQIEEVIKNYLNIDKFVDICKSEMGDDYINKETNLEDIKCTAIQYHHNYRPQENANIFYERLRESA